jgi:chromate transporter
MIDFLHAHLAHLFNLFAHFAGLSLLSVGGVIMLTPAMSQYLVDETHWLSAAQLNAAISISQAAPGPNILFVAVMGWYVGGNWLAASTPNASAWLSISVSIVCGLIALLGILIPSTLLTYGVAHWLRRNQQRTVVQAFKQGMPPIVIAMLIATGYIMAQAGGRGDWRDDWPTWLLTGCSALLAWRTQMHLLVLLAAGAVFGALAWV